MVSGYFFLHTHNRIETMETKLHQVGVNAVRAKEAVVDLEQTSAGLKEELNRAQFKRNELQNQLKHESWRIEHLSENVDAAKALQENYKIVLEGMRSDLDVAKQSALRSEAEAARSTEHLASLEAQLDENNSARNALQTELQRAHSAIEQLKTSLAKVRSELVEKGSRPRPDQSELGVARRDPANSQRKNLKQNSLGNSTSQRIEKARTALDLGSEGRDYMIRTIVFEASGETEIGKTAVAYVILNRKRTGSWGDRIRDVVTYPRQFEPWMTRKDEIAQLSPNDPRYLDAAKVADDVLTGLIPDPTAGATHFLNPVVVRQRRGGSLPSWAAGDGQPIGRHVFYSPLTSETYKNRQKRGAFS